MDMSNSLNGPNSNLASNATQPISQDNYWSSHGSDETDCSRGLYALSEIHEGIMGRYVGCCILK